MSTSDKATTASEREPGRQEGAPVASFHHGAISRFNAWFFTSFAGLINHMARHHKRHAFAGIAADTVVELGAGTGANLEHIPPGATLYAVEPSRAMHEGLRRRATAAGIDLHVQASGAERLELPDGSVDDVICSLTLCTVGDPQAVVQEVLRILRPGGRFRFVEHVAAPDGPRARVQRAVRRPWSWVFEGCDTHRHSHDLVARAGFTSLQLEHRKLRRSPFWPVNTAVWGIAVR